MNNFSIKIVGPAGFGIKSTGVTLAKSLVRSGLNVFAYTEYPSLIRGGHNTYQVDVSDSEIKASKEKADVLIPLNLEALEKEKNNIEKDGIVICDETTKQQYDKTTKQQNIKIIPVPLIEIAKKHGGELMKNTVALGVLFKLLNLDLEILNGVIKEAFAGKEGVAEQNIKAVEEGFNFKLDKNFNEFNGFNGFNENNLFITGNQATAMAVTASGCQLYSAYPMTPATDILHVLEANQKKTGMVVHQPEDEIAAIHTALGGSFAGIRSACGTSGGGFALMNEGLSLTGMLELPLVIFEVMRPGPATGNPTWSDQGDLSYVLNAGHGDFPRAVIAPGSPEQVFDCVQHAFNLADKYQIPAIVISDKHLGESGFTISKEVFSEIDEKNHDLQLKANKDYKRYLNTQTGISPRTIPGIENGEHIANSDEHNEESFSDESSEVRKMQMEKRMKKVEELRKEIPLPKVYGEKNAEITLVSWGSAFGACLDAVNLDSNINLIHFTHLWPMPKGLDKFLSQFNKLVLVENNYSGQLGKLIRQETGIEIKNKILKYDSRPFWKGEIINKLKTK